MMVLFVSQCEKKALRSTRRILDAFADRIGDNTWRTIITEDGLAAVRALLRKNATKNTAVACHWVRSRSRSELAWIVGSRSKFSKGGLVPVNSTKQNLRHSDWENDWAYLPQIKALTAVAALLHDSGKASCLFQKKLKSNSKLGDPLRHEWISCALLHALVIHSGDLNSDTGWLRLLNEWSFDETKVVEIVQEQHEKILSQLPPLAQMVAWLIISHHRLPSLYDENLRNGYASVTRSTFAAALKQLDERWGYKNDQDGSFAQRVSQCFSFQFGLLKKSDLLAKQLKKWAGRLLMAEESILVLLSEKSLRLTLQYSRLCLMLSDHYVSSLDAESNWRGDAKLYANTDPEHKGLKQKLDEHLLRVTEQSLKISQSLTRFSEQMEKAYDVKALKQKSPADFAWQDRAVEKIKSFRQEQEVADGRGQGWFVVNMASTGCGKTIANAKIMQAISEDGEGLRYILALGLRTLTLQTGDEYRTRIGLNPDELAVLIGSAAFKELHEQKSKNDSKNGDDAVDNGSESLETLLGEELDYIEGPTAEFLDHFFPTKKPKVAEKNKAFLYKPVLACTIDHMIGATETTRGGKYILPFLRLMSSDLVIDEVDDFGLQDLIAIGRLVHLTGMLGRSVAISSATIPPGLAEGLYNAYQEGWECYRSFYKKSKQPVCVWCDEFSAKVEMLQGAVTEERCQSYAAKHKEFVAKRVRKLEEQCVKRKAYIVSCSHLLGDTAAEKQLATLSREEQYFGIIKEEIRKLHVAHSWVDPKTEKQISFGVVRVANIKPCIELSQHLIAAEWGDDFSPYVMAYHSRQVLLLRHEQERHLDEVLKRKEKPGEEPAALSNPQIRKCIDEASTKNVVFILVATPVEEVGRDHDLDWAVIEPSSYRSIIQLVGRIFRHRKLKGDIGTPNIAIMQYNLKGLAGQEGAVFCRPGYESDRHQLITHNMKELVNEEELSKGVNAIPRIVAATTLHAEQKLADLEHVVMNDFKERSYQGPAVLQGWLTGYWWLTALHQQFNRFRAGSPQVKLYLAWKDGNIAFYERTDQGAFVKREDCRGMKYIGTYGKEENRQWLSRQYNEALERQLSIDGEEDEQKYVEEIEKISQRFGEVNVLERDLENKNFIYVDQFGLMEEK